MTQRQLNKLVKIKRILKEREDAKEPQIIKDYVLNGIVPKNEKTLKIAQQLKDFHKNMIDNNLYPSMPCDDWIARHGTDAQPENYDVNLDDGINYGPYKESEIE